MKLHKTRILPATPERLDEAVAILRQGGIVAIPTETVYGLAANALDPDAVARIFEAKGRPPQNPLIVHVANITEALRLTAQWPREAQLLAETFWPGPLTLVLEKRAGVVPDITTAGGNTVAVRCPDHPVALELIEKCGFPLAAPSANRSNHISPTQAEHVAKSLGGRIELVLDAGPCRAGIESTVINLTGSNPEILRPGSISAAEINKVLSGQPDLSDETNGTNRDTGKVSPERNPNFLSPGLQKTHYAPDTPLLLTASSSIAALLARLSRENKRVGVMMITLSDVKTSANFKVVQMANNPLGFGAALYSALHLLDDAHLDVIVCENPPDTTEWAAVRDRLQRAGTSVD